MVASSCRNHVALYGRSRDRRGSEPDIHSTSFEVEVDADSRHEGKAFSPSSTTDAGLLPSALFSAVLSRHLDEIYRCATKGGDLRRWPTTITWVSVDFVINEPGAITDIGVSGGDVPEHVFACAVEVLERLRFPPPAGGVAHGRFGFPVYS